MSFREVVWTGHAQFKMKFYGISHQRALGVIRRPERTEEGVFPGTVAVMQPVSMKVIDGKKIWRTEIWAMYERGHEGKVRIISVWRYPGVSPLHSPIPVEIFREIEYGVE